MKRVLLWVLPTLLWCAGNLFEENPSSPAVVRCMGSVEIKNSHTPVTLFGAAAKCIEEEHYEEAVNLYLVAVAYGYFDSERVVDKGSREILERLKLNDFGKLDATKRNQFAQELRKRLDDIDPTCRFLATLGKPSYFPKYMVEVSKNPFSSKSTNGLLPGYNANALWQQTRFNYFHCP
jgi:hypothetical protein